jgi:DNA polymerase-3 subunit delta
MAGKQENTYDDIVRDIRAQRYKPIYYLMGEEPYYIDSISDLIANTVLSEEERAFNQVILYGADTDVSTIINTAKSFPMGARYQVVIVKEAQAVRNIEELAYYAQKPQPSTILVICHKNGTLDRRKKLAGEIQKVGVLFESKKLHDNNMPTFIISYLKKKQVAIDNQSAMLMAEHVGNDLHRTIGELDKLIITLPKGEKTITPEQIERNIGISKNFNNFELLNALVTKNIYKATQIVKYFDSNPKNNPVQVTLALLFNFYSNLMLAYYAPQKSPDGIAAWLGIPSWQVKNNYLPAMRNYSGTKVMQIVEGIRRTDAKSKGIDNAVASPGELLEELIFFILH